MTFEQMQSVARSIAAVLQGQPEVDRAEYAGDLEGYEGKPGEPLPIHFELAEPVDDEETIDFVLMLDVM